VKRIKTTERAGWDAQAEALGFTWRHADGRRYWDERAYYAFTLEGQDEERKGMRVERNIATAVA